MGTDPVIRPWQVNQKTTATPASPVLQSQNNFDPLNQIPIRDVLGYDTFSSTSTQNTDPYAQYGGRAAYNSLLSGFNTQKQNIFGSSLDAARTAGIGLKSNILDFIDSLRQGQRSIDSSAVDNELARQRGTQDVYSSVNRGIQSGGQMLTNRNASDSSAAEAIARAYGDIGRRSLSQVGNQYELNNRSLGEQQQILDEQRAAGIRKFGESKEQIVGNIVVQARNSLAALDAAMLEASLPERIAIEQEKENIRQQVLAELSQYDALLTSQAGAIAPTSQADRISEATRLGAAGRAPSTAFNFDTMPAAQFQNTGPFASELPLFTLNRRRE